MIRPLLSLTAPVALYLCSPQSPGAALGCAIGALAGLVLCLVAKPAGGQQ